MVCLSRLWEMVDLGITSDADHSAGDKHVVYSNILINRCEYILNK